MGAAHIQEEERPRIDFMRLGIGTNYCGLRLYSTMVEEGKSVPCTKTLYCIFYDKAQVCGEVSCVLTTVHFMWRHNTTPQTCAL